MSRPSIILILTLLSLKVFLSCSSHKSQTLPASLFVEDTVPTKTLNPALFGSNIQWEWKGDGLLDEKNQLNIDALELAKALRLSYLRFPGGSLSNNYRWKDAIGPRDSRAPGLSFAETQIPSDFGSDEFIAVLKELTLKPVITLNSSLSPSYAREWLDYLKNTGQIDLNRSYWEIGNEVYSPNETGYTSASSYAQKANIFARELRLAESDIHVGAALEVSFVQAAWMDQVYPHLRPWNEEVIKGLSKDIDFISLHFYAPYDKVFNNNELSALTLAGPVVFQQNLAIIEDLLTRYQRTDIKFAITEYNTFFGDQLSLDERTAKPEAALFSALLLFEMADNPRIVLANHWSLLNNAVFGLYVQDSNGNWQTRPSFNVMKELSGQANNEILTTRLLSPTYAVEAKGNIPKIDNIEMLDTLVTRDENSVHHYNIVNRSPTVTLTLDLSDKLSQASSIQLKQWAAKTWRDSGTSQEISAVDGKYRIVLPPLSFTHATTQASTLVKSRIKRKNHESE